VSSPVTGPATIGSTTAHTGAVFLTAISALLSDSDEAVPEMQPKHAKTSVVAPIGIESLCHVTMAGVLVTMVGVLVMIAHGAAATRIGAMLPVIAKDDQAPAHNGGAKETLRSAAQAAESRPALLRVEAVLVDQKVERNPAAVRAVDRNHPAHAAAVVAEGGVAADDYETRFRRHLHEGQH